MSAYDYTYLVHRVRTALDEDLDDSSLVSEGDTSAMSLREIIKHSIEEAAKIVESAAPIHLIDEGKTFAGSIGWVSGVPGAGCGIITLPDDFMRLVCFQMTGWRTSVSEVITEDSPEYLIQSSPVESLRGNSYRPVVAITHGTKGLQLEFYSGSGAGQTTVRKARYLPIPKFVNNTIEICDKLLPAVVYYSAYLTMTTLGNTEMATGMKQIAEELMK